MFKFLSPYLLVLSLSCAFFPNALAATLTVNSTADADDAALDGICDVDLGADGSQCTLRAAIQEANSTIDPDDIVFDLAGPSPHIFQPATPYDSVIRELSIDGTTQDDFVAGQLPVIVIDGSNAGDVASFLRATSRITVRGLNIHSFADAGLGIFEGGDNSVIEGNVIGLSTDGASAAFNNMGIIANANNVRIGGALPAQRNVISGNNPPRDTAAIYVGGENTVIQGNYIGTDFSGLNAIENINGIRVVDTSVNTRIGGINPGEGNIISGNQSMGIDLDGTGALVQGNYIGVDASGNAALPNGSYGIIINGPSNTIGGTTVGARNIISANQQTAIHVEDHSNTIQGNYIGLGANGVTLLGNTRDGIDVENGNNNVIGGSEANARNVIAANLNHGIQLRSNENIVSGNYIGTLADGITAAGNGSAGIRVAGGFNILGGDELAEGNIVAANFQGLDIPGSNNTVQGNFIGLAADGSTALGNRQDGILLSGSLNTVGGNTPLKGNVIVSNGIDGFGDGGIEIASINNTVIGNFIGTDRSGELVRGNVGNGIYGFISGSIIGTLAEGEQNIIVNNSQSGIALSGNTNYFFGNLIHDNALLSIDLPGMVGLPDSPDALDMDGGLQNQPVLSDFLVFADGSALISGTLSSKASASYDVYFYSQSNCADPTVDGESEAILGAKTIETNAEGQATFEFNLNALPESAAFVSAIANSAEEGSSEFSNCIAFELVEGDNPNNDNPGPAGDDPVVDDNGSDADDNGGNDSDDDAGAGSGSSETPASGGGGGCTLVLPRK